MKKIIIIIFTLILLSVNFIFANEPDTVGYYSPTISFEVDYQSEISSVIQTLTSSETNHIEINFSKALVGNEIGIYVNSDLIDTLIILNNVFQYTYDINIRAYDNGTLNLFVYDNSFLITHYSDSLPNNKSYINSVIQSIISAETSQINISVFNPYDINRIEIYVNDVFIDSQEIITGQSDNYIFNVLHLENSELTTYIFYDSFEIDSRTQKLINNAGFYSPVISFEVNFNAFQFDLTQYISDYSRYKKIWELYPQLSGVSGFKFWHELVTLENDNYYREPNLPYLKFKRLADKYK